MADILECPACGHEHDMGGYPDHISEARYNRFWFECAGCEAEFETHIDWDPVFYPITDSIKRKAA